MQYIEPGQGDGKTPISNGNLALASATLRTTLCALYISAPTAICGVLPVAIAIATPPAP